MRYFGVFLRIIGLKPLGENPGHRAGAAVPSGIYK